MFGPNRRTDPPGVVAIRCIVRAGRAVLSILSRPMLRRANLGVVAPAPSGTGVLTPGTGPGPGWVDFPFGMTPEVFVLELRSTAAVFAQRIR